MNIRIEKLSANHFYDALDDLAEILRDCVEGGAAVSFMPPLALEKARAFWLDQFTQAQAGTKSIFVARDESGIHGVVMLVPAWSENQPHRADVSKLLVHRRARGRGLAKALMTALEHEARRIGKTLLTLDTKKGDVAERLYPKWGYIHAGIIPDFALDADGRTTPTVLFYKKI